MPRNEGRAIKTSQQEGGLIIKMTSYDIPINDSMLNKHGFAGFQLPVTNKQKSFMGIINADGRKITFCPFYRLDLGKSSKSLERELLVEKLVDEETARGLAVYFENECKVRLEEDPNFNFFVDSDGNGKTAAKNSKSNSKEKEKEKEPAKREFTAYKYSNRGKDSLHEAIILDGRPVFLTYINGEIKRYDAIEENIRIIKPPHAEHYAYEPYEFANMDEVLRYVDRALNENIDSLYLQAKRIAADYNDQRKDKINLLAIEIISSYFQDKFPTVHYDIVLGGNGSGKSSYGDTFTSIGYRVVNLTDPNAANINRILGTVEIGQCCIVSDETRGIEKHPDLLSILNTGYSPRGKTSKINDNSRDPEFFFTYGFKMIIAERMLNLREAKGVVDRSFSFTTYKGVPRYDIKETLTPQGDPARQARLDALNDFRKLMLIYRLLHYKDVIEDIDVGIEGREKELAKPNIQLFYKTKSQAEVESTFQNFLTLRNEKKEINIEPVLYAVVRDLASKSKDNEISIKEIWEQLRLEIPDGSYDERKPNVYETLEYGTIYNNSISNILEHTFGGRPKHRSYGNTFIFDTEELRRIGRAYNISTKIQTKMIITEENQGILIEGMKALEPYREASTSENEAKNEENEGNPRGNFSTNNEEKEGVPSVEPSEPSAPSNKNLQDSSSIMYECYHCNDFHTNEEREYQRHVMSNHQKGTADKDHPCYPCKADIQRLGLKTQGKSWEI